MVPDEPASRSSAPESGSRAGEWDSGRRRKMMRGRRVDQFLAPVS